MSTLLTMITTRAKETFTEEVTKENYPVWEAHWYKTADGFIEQFEAEGLTKTVEKVRALIDWQRGVGKSMPLVKIKCQS